MWTRKFRAKMGDIDQEAFTKAFICALSNEHVLEKIHQSIGASLKIDINDIKTSQANIQKDIADIKVQNESLKTDNEKLVKRIDEQDAKIRDLESALQECFTNIDITEQASRLLNLRISGISSNEDPHELAIKLFNDKMDLEIEGSDIERAYRIGPVSDENRPLIVRFTSQKIRDQVYRNRTKLKKLKSDSSRGAKDGIYINEDLTKVRASRLKRLRDLKKDKKINDCWSWNGAILLKDNQNNIHRINRNNDIFQFTQ